MARNRRVALLIDVDNVKISKESVEELFDQLNTNGEIVYCKFYGYNDRKHLYLSDFIQNYGYETAPFMRLKKRFSQLDNRIIVDAVRINYTKPDIDAFCIVAGDGDLIPLLVELKSCGKTVIDINTDYQEVNAHMFDEHIFLRTMGKEVETYTAKSKKPAATKKKAAAKTTKAAAPKRAAEPAPAPRRRVAAPVYDDYDYEEEIQYVQPAPRTRVVRQAAPVTYVQPQPVYAQPQPVYAQPVQQPAPQPQPVKQAAPAPAPKRVEKQAPVQPEPEDYDSYFDDDEITVVSKPKNEDVDVYADADYTPSFDEDYDLSEVLKDITTRYNQLDFTTNDNMNEKLRLIRDIENLIESENAKGEGVYSENEDIRQIFSDLQDVVDDMKNAL